jgi:hypothetical protein
MTSGDHTLRASRICQLKHSKEVNESFTFNAIASRHGEGEVDEMLMSARPPVTHD